MTAGLLLLIFASFGTFHSGQIGTTFLPQSLPNHKLQTQNVSKPNDIKEFFKEEKKELKEISREDSYKEKKEKINPPIVHCLSEKCVPEPDPTTLPILPPYSPSPEPDPTTLPLLPEYSPTPTIEPTPQPTFRPDPENTVAPHPKFPLPCQVQDTKFPPGTISIPCPEQF